jgi:hypothetical protein
MSKLSAETPPVLNTKSKKSKGTKKPANDEAAPNTNDRPIVSKTATSTEDDAISPTDDNEDTPLASETVASTPKKKKGAKVVTPKKGAKAFTPKEKDAEAADPKKGSKAGGPKAKPKKPPVADGFLPYTPKLKKPEPNDFWGRKPVPGDPRPDPDQPSARASNGQTNPPLWENRGYRYKRGERYVKHHYTVEPKNIQSLPRDRDQEVLLEVPVIDMRPKHASANNSRPQDLEPKRVPDYYCYKRTPKDWNCKQTIKALNDRRYQGIDRMTMDAPWTRMEQEYLARLIRENPDGSIWELTELHNDRFMGKDYKEDVGLAKGSLSTGRTVESVRYQYTAYKPFYDRGKVPQVRWRGDKSLEGVALKKIIVDKFGQPSRAEERAHDNAHGGTEESDDDAVDDDEDDTPKKPEPKKKKRASETIEESDDEDESKAKRLKTGTADPFAGQDKLDDDDEELLKLAVARDEAEEDEEMNEEEDSDAEDQVDSNIHATRDMEMDENYDDEE